MTMTELANTMLQMVEVIGDRKVNFIEEETGDTRYVAGISFDIRPQFSLDILVTKSVRQ